MFIYHFTLQYANFQAEVALDEKGSLYELAELLIKAVGFDLDHAFEFCDNAADPYASATRYTLFADLGDPEANDPGVKETLIGGVFQPGREMGFLFDYGDDWIFRVTCRAVMEEKGRKRVKKVLSRTGTPPVQYP